MNITISIDDQMFQKAYLFAKAMNKTVEQLICEYFQQFESDADKEIAEFRRLTAQGQGRSKGWRFDREEIYDTVKQSLIREGWTITHAPYIFQTDPRLAADLGAERCRTGV